MTIREDLAAVLQHLGTYPQYTGAQNEELAKALDMSPERLNTAVSLLENSGYVKPLRVMGTGPFDFAKVEITPHGKLELERAEADAEASRREAPAPEVRPSPFPIGSPFGFTDLDWEYIGIENKSSKLIVVFAHQWQSEHYDSATLINALSDEFAQALAKSLAAGSLSLGFVPLRAGYGEHVFNQIARSIIAADIGVFETSDLNPNVMIEMGVALTWGTRVHPIREESRPEPPSDISGQTWACYRDSGGVWTDPDHFDRVVQMVESAARKKLSGRK